MPLVTTGGLRGSRTLPSQYCGVSAPHSRLLDPREVPGASVPAGTGLNAAGLSTASLMVAPAHLGLMPVRGVVLLALLHHKGFNDFFQS